MEPRHQNRADIRKTSDDVLEAVVVPTLTKAVRDANTTDSLMMRGLSALQEIRHDLFACEVEGVETEWQRRSLMVDLPTHAEQGKGEIRVRNGQAEGGFGRTEVPACRGEQAPAIGESLPTEDEFPDLGADLRGKAQ